jgi:membrane protease YdiL (CAAX protease family)
MDSNPEFLSTPQTPSFAEEADVIRKPRGYAWLAWLVIIATIVLMVFRDAFVVEGEIADPSTIVHEIQAKYLVGASTLSGENREMAERQIKLIYGSGSLRQQLMGAILVGELVGPDAVVTSLETLDSKVRTGQLNASDDDQKILELLKQIEAAVSTKTPLDQSMKPDDWNEAQTFLPKKLGWIGRLALFPPGSPDRDARTRLIDHGRRTVFVMLGVFLLAILAASGGLLLQILWIVFAATGRLRSGIGPLQGNGAIYAETFAVWMVLFIVLNIGVMSLPIRKLGLIVVLIPQIGGIGALAWPILRGLSWRDVKTDIGLTLGPQPWSIPFVGVGAYLSALPVVGVAMLITLLMMAVAGQFAGEGDATGGPVHPIVEPILRGSWATRMQLVIVAIFAAVPEEIFFRGVLYRHLRETGIRVGYLFGVAFAATISSFVFAVIHPQGLFGIPILMGLAMVFALVREWRGSLIPCMIAHALVNAGTSTVLLLIAD